MGGFQALEWGDTDGGVQAMGKGFQAMGRGFGRGMIESGVVKARMGRISATLEICPGGPGLRAILLFLVRSKNNLKAN
jgi:hypothetical protein